MDALPRTRVLRGGRRMKAAWPLEETGLKDWAWHGASEQGAEETAPADVAPPACSSEDLFTPEEEKEAALPFVLFSIPRAETDPTFQLF